MQSPFTIQQGHNLLSAGSLDTALGTQSKMPQQAAITRPQTGNSVPSSLAAYCDAPRLSASTYKKPRHAKGEYDNSTLIHVVHVQRHHKRTPDNLVPNNEALYNPLGGWQCEGIDLYDAAVGKHGAAHIRRMYHNPLWNPLHERIWNGTCDAGQLTVQGLEDSVAHGRDLASVYGVHGVNPLLSAHGKGLEEEILLRASPEERTRHVAGGLLRGLGYPDGRAFPAIVMPEAVDGIIPSYTCAHGDKLRAAIEQERDWKVHLSRQRPVFDQFNSVLGTSNDSDWNSWIDHAFDFLSSRQCHGHALPRDPVTGLGISQALADSVYAEGDWEYNYIWNQSPRADEYVRYSFAVFVQELVVLLRGVQRQGATQHKLSLFVGHDGTMVRLLKTLGQPRIPWPGMGSEVQFEVYQVDAGRSSKEQVNPDDASDHLFVRILAGGKSLVTRSEALQSTARDKTRTEALDRAEWTPLKELIAFLEQRIPRDLKERCA